MNFNKFLKLLESKTNNRNYIGKIFFASLTTAFIFTNSKFLLIYFSDTINIYEKLSLLSNEEVLYLKPIVIAFLFTIFSTILNILFYMLTLKDMELKQRTTNRMINIENQEVNLIELSREEKIKREKNKLNNQDEGYI